MLLLQYIDELQDSKCSSISRKYGGSPLQMDFLRRRTDKARSSITVLNNEKDSSIKEKYGDCPPLEMDVLRLKADQPGSPVGLPVYKADQTGFHFIIKYPAQELHRALARGRVEILINDFLDTLFNLGTDPNRPTEDRQTSPLTYEHHEEIRQDQTITEVKVRLQLQPGVDAGSTRAANLQLCEKIHSARAREVERPCLHYLSTLDIFGLEPVQSTEFSICWDAAFFSQMISDGQNVLESLTAQATSLASNLVGLCEWAASNLLLLTQILRGSWVGSKSCNVLFTCPELQALRLLEAAGSLLAKLVDWKNAPWRPSAQARQHWKNDVWQASRELQHVTTTIAALATTAAMPDGPLVEQAKELYFASHSFLRACQKAITCNRAIWRRFQAGYLVGGGGVVLGTGFIATTVGKGIQSGVASLVPETVAMGALGVAGAVVTVASLGYGAFELWNTKQYDNICESFDECLVTTLRIIFSCETITRRLFLPQNEPAAAGYAANLQREKWWQDFVGEAIRTTGDDPATTTFTLHRHYSAYLTAQNSGLQRVQKRLDTVAAQRRFLDL